MPIKDKSLYPKNWKELSRRIRKERAGDKCELCGRVNLRWGFWYEGQWNDGGETQSKCIETIIQFEQERMVDVELKQVRTVLTVAHLDHDTTNNADDNLKALCQRCHLRHDALLHATNAARTRATKREKQELDADRRRGQRRLV